MSRYILARDEDGEPIPCEVCAGTGIASYGPVENGCVYCRGTGQQHEPMEPEEREYDPPDDYDAERADYVNEGFRE